MTWLPFAAALIGALSLGLVAGFVVGVAWGVNFARAVEAKSAPEEPLVPQYWPPEKIARAAAAAGITAPRTPEAPRPYKMPGMDDGI